MSANLTNPEISEVEQREIKRVLGFDPTLFFDDVNDKVNSALTQGMAAFKQELLSSSQVKSQKVKEKDIDKACSQLYERLEESVHKNFDIFELYSRRNIFTLPRSDVDSHSPPRHSPSKSPSSKQLEQLDHEIDAIKARYVELQHRHRILLNECGDNDRLLKDMRSALFHLRVGAQVLDENNLQPLEDTVRAIVEQKGQLVDLSARASGLIQDIRGRPDHRSDRSNHRHYDDIRTANAEDLQMLSEMLDDDEEST